MLRITKTENGAVKGFPGTDARITVFKGIPFAQDTSGENRWRSPQPVENWEGVRECYDFGDVAMQKTPGLDPDAFYSKEWHVDQEVPMGEDCLRANIWTPAISTDEKLPVMVWIYGGGLKEGYAHEMEFDGERIASRGVILVSIGYRVNVFGLLAHPDLTKENPEAPANWAYQDQAAGIAWVKRNIENFGGDPNNITIFGQSAGATSVIAQMASPKTEGLFQKAIIESIGGVGIKVPQNTLMPCYTLEEAERLGVEFFKILGVSTVEEARKLDAKFIEDKFLETDYFWGSVVDGKFLTKSLDDSVISNSLHDVTFMIGNTVNEFQIIPEGDSDDEVIAWIRDNFGEDADEYIDICKSTGLPLNEAAKVGQMEIGNMIMNKLYADYGKDFYYYRFGPTIPGDDAGAFHSSDLWFQFETLMKCWRPFDGHHFDLSRKICNYWTNFAKNGDPNGLDKDGTEMPYWPKFSNESPRPIFLGDEIILGDSIWNKKNTFLVDVNMKAHHIK